MKQLITTFIIFFSLGVFAQQNIVSLSFGLNIADERIFRQREYRVDSRNVVARLSYLRSVKDYMRLRADFAYADYQIYSIYLDPINPLPEVRPFSRYSLSIGPQFTMATFKKFSFLAGFNAGFHYGSDPSVQDASFRASYFDIAINPLSICYQLKGFTIDLDTYIGSNMYSNVFIGVGYAF